MKKTLFIFTILLLFLSNHLYGQITIMRQDIQKPKHENFRYDSLKNMVLAKYENRYTYHHLIGQTLMYCGNPYQDANYGREKSNFQSGDYYKVDSILPDNPNKGLYNRLSLINVKTGEKEEENGEGLLKFTSNYEWVVLGHYEKIKSLYLNKNFVYVIDTYMSGLNKPDGMINIKTDTVTKRIKMNTVWTCVDVQVKPRTKEDGMYEFDKRSPIILIFDNPEYGPHYCYLEDREGKPYENTQKENMPLVCGKFQLKSYYDKIKAISTANKAKRKAELTKKFGVSNANLILEGKVRIGMTKDMCKEAWGSPRDINRTISDFGTHEQWVYGSGQYLYFENGKLTSIQN